MPLSSDESIVKLSNDIVSLLKDLAGKHPGYRPAHARGVMLTGSFKPTPEAATLSTAPQFFTASTPVTVRFSSSTGIPQISDKDSAANPRGFGLRFHLGDRIHTDIIAHSTPFFPVKNGEEFLELFRALASGKPDEFLRSHPKALAFVQAPKPSPSSFARESYFGVTALKFVSKVGKESFFRYRILPEAGVETLDGTVLQGKSSNYLYDDVPELISKGPITFKLVAQLAEEGDIIDDATEHWPETRKLVQLGTIVLDALVKDNEAEQKHIIFDPIPRVGGIESSSDPLLEVRAAVYLISGRERRAA